MSDPYEHLLMQWKEIFIYKVPPLKSASGHRAEDWKLDVPLLTGAMKISQNDTKLYIRLYSYKNPKSLSLGDDNVVLFGECPIEVQPKGDIMTFVDAVIDSSRYYVVKLKDQSSTRTTLIGIGFREREDAFDFKNILNDYVRYVDRMALADQSTTGIAVFSRSNTHHDANSSLPTASTGDADDLMNVSITYILKL